MNYEELVARAKTGDKVAMEELINNFKYYIIKCSNNVYINGYEVEDLIQIGNLSLINAIKKYDLTKGNFTAYVTMSIKNNYKYLIRGKVKENYVGSLNASIGENAELGEILMMEESFEEELMRSETIKLVLQCVDKLPEDLKEIIYCYINNNKTMKQFSIDKNMKYSTLMKKKELAIERLRVSLKEVQIME